MVLDARTKPCWGDFEFKDEKWKRLLFPPHKLWLKMKDHLLSMVLEPESEDYGPGFQPAGLVPGDFPPEDLPVSHYRTGGDGSKIAFGPRLPDRAVVVSHGDNLYVLPDEELRAYCALPLSIALLESPSGREIAERASRKLSKTLFGDTDNGEILYSYPKNLEFTPAPFMDKPLDAVCPILIRNVSPERLLVKRLCVRVEFLGIYWENDKVFTDEICFSFKGEKYGSQISVHPFKGYKNSNPELIFPAKTPYSNRLIRKSFDFFRSIGQ